MTLGRSILAATVLGAVIIGASSVRAEDPVGEHYLVERLVRDGAMLSGSGPGILRENYVMVVMAQFRTSSGDDQILDSDDVVAAQGLQKASYRSRIVQRIMENDIDGDGSAGKDEIRRALSFSSQPLNVDGLVRGYLVADADGDSRITAAEAEAFAAARRPRHRERIPVGEAKAPVAVMTILLSLDADGDGRLTGNELEARAKTTFARYDVDEDGIIDPEEGSALDASGTAALIMRRAMLTSSRGDCEFPKASPEAKLIYVGGYEAGTLSNVSVAGQDNETETVEIAVQAGTRPLVILASAFTPMIWRLTGEVARVEKIVVTDSGNPNGFSGSGVTGIPASKISYVSPQCMPSASGSKEERQARTILQAALGRPLDETLISYTLQNLSGELPRAGQSRDRPAAKSLDLQVVLSKPLRLPSHSDKVHSSTYDSLLRFSPGGYAEIDPAAVVSAGKAERYEVLPQEAGLVQLLEEGSLVWDRGYRIVKPLPRFPAGLAGAHAVKFLLAPGIPLPAGDPGHSTVVSEETGAVLVAPNKIRTEAVIDPFDRM